jgi:hypothetical protein
VPTITSPNFTDLAPHYAHLRASTGGFLALALMALTSCGGQVPPCPFCPAAWMQIGLVVNAATGGGVLTDGEATLSGPESVTMSCRASGTEMVCEWPPEAPVTEGTYTLQVTATGFHSANVRATVTVGRDQCRCGAALVPSQVTLDPS